MKIRNMILVVLLVMFAAVIALIYVGNQREEALKTPAQRQEEAAIEACRTDWTKCKDNKDIANHNGMDYAHARSECRHAADQQAKFGTPEWSWYTFGTFQTGNSALVTGEMILVDRDVKFANGFGAMAHVTVTCLYDLRNKRVIKLEIEQPD